MFCFIHCPYLISHCVTNFVCLFTLKCLSLPLDHLVQKGLKGPEARSSVLGGLWRLMAWVRTLILLLFSHVILVGYFLSI